MSKPILGLLTFMTYALMSSSVYADPSLIKDKETQKPIAAIGLAEVMNNWSKYGCAQHFGKFVLEEVAYDGVSEIVGGIRVREISNDGETANLRLMTIDTRGIPNSDLGWLPELFEKDKEFYIAYSLCGNGGHLQVRDAYKIPHLSW